MQVKLVRDEDCALLITHRCVVCGDLQDTAKQIIGIGDMEQLFSLTWE